MSFLAQYFALSYEGTKQRITTNLAVDFLSLRSLDFLVRLSIPLECAYR